MEAIKTLKGRWRYKWQRVRSVMGFSRWVMGSVCGLSHWSGEGVCSWHEWSTGSVGVTATPKINKWIKTHRKVCLFGQHVTIPGFFYLPIPLPFWSFFKQRKVAILRNPIYRVKSLENCYVFFISFVIFFKKVFIWGC